MEHELKSKLMDWVLKKNTEVDKDSIDYDTNLIENRIINSIHIMDLILYMESLRGSPVDIERIKPGAFASINSIYETFFVEECKDA